MAACLAGGRRPDALPRVSRLARSAFISLGALAADQFSKHAVEKFTAGGIAARADSRVC